MFLIHLLLFFFLIDLLYLFFFSYYLFAAGEADILDGKSSGTEALVLRKAMDVRQTASLNHNNSFGKDLPYHTINHFN